VGGEHLIDDSPIMEVNRELMALRRAQMILNASGVSSMADRKAITDRTMELMHEHGLLPEDDG
jgi:hypothetical protein